MVRPVPGSASVARRHETSRPTDATSRRGWLETRPGFGLQLVAGSPLRTSDPAVQRKKGITAALPRPNGARVGARAHPERGWSSRDRGRRGVLFDGRMWHGSHRQPPAALVRCASAVRAADSPLRCRSPGSMAFHFLSAPRPPPSSSRRGQRLNRLVPRQRASMKRGCPCCPRYSPARPAAAEHPDGGGSRIPVQGSTGFVCEITSTPLCDPRPLAASPDAHSSKSCDRSRARPSLLTQRPDRGRRPFERSARRLFLLPAGQHHSIRNADRRVTYMMFSCTGDGRGGRQAARDSSPYDTPEADGAKGFVTRTLFSANQLARPSALPHDLVAAGPATLRTSTPTTSPHHLSGRVNARAGGRAQRRHLLLGGRAPRDEEHRRRAGALSGVRIPCPRRRIAQSAAAAPAAAGQAAAEARGRRARRAPGQQTLRPGRSTLSPNWWRSTR